VPSAGLGEAVAAHAEALRLRPDFADAHNNLALDLAASGRTARRSVISIAPWRCTQGSSRLPAGWQKLLRTPATSPKRFAGLEASVRAVPGSAAAHNNLGTHLARFGRGEEAIAAYERALRLDPGLAAARISSGLRWARPGVGFMPPSIFEVAAKLQPESADAFAGLGVALGNAGRLDTAALSFNRALQLNPASPGLHDASRRSAAGARSGPRGARAPVGRGTAPARTGPGRRREPALSGIRTRLPGFWRAVTSPR
jgi:tetratricopeptide (TPR) repeat protein